MLDSVGHVNTRNLQDYANLHTINPVNVQIQPLPTAYKCPTLQKWKESLRHYIFLFKFSFACPKQNGFPLPLPLLPKSHITPTALTFFLKCAPCPLLDLATLHLPLDLQKSLPVFLSTALKLKEDPMLTPLYLHSCQ